MIFYEPYEANIKSETGQWRIINGELVNCDSPFIEKIKSHGPEILESWYIDKENNRLWNKYWIDYVLFKKDFPINVWKFNSNNTELISLDMIEYANFRHEFPINVWKIEDDNGVLSIIYLKDLAYFKKEFPISVWQINKRDEDSELEMYQGINIEILGGFANNKDFKQITISDSVKYIKSKAFYKTSLKEVTIANDCEYFKDSFPKDCKINGGILIS